MSEIDSKEDASLGEEDVSVSIATQDIKVKFKGPLQSVLKSTLEFFLKEFPEVDLGRKISLNYDTHHLIEEYSRLIKISPEGVRVLVQPDTSSSAYTSEEKSTNESGLKDDRVVEEEHEGKWTIKEIIGIQLVASRIAKDRGIIQDEGMKIPDIVSATNANPKSLTSRLSEMIKSGFVTKDLKFLPESAAEGKEEPSTIYRITTVGIHWLNNTIDKKRKDCESTIKSHFVPSLSK